MGDLWAGLGLILAGISLGSGFTVILMTVPQAQPAEAWAPVQLEPPPAPPAGPLGAWNGSGSMAMVVKAGPLSASASGRQDVDPLIVVAESWRSSILVVVETVPAWAVFEVCAWDEEGSSGHCSGNVTSGREFELHPSERSRLRVYPRMMVGDSTLGLTYRWQAREIHV